VVVVINTMTLASVAPRAAARQVASGEPIIDVKA